ncbi:hypothetical protein EIN_065910 [Entamoeba invadens IP1]|uniref:Uncharacterized protein n=1 Tax=Entamoeba invadens IP1 TaxID=370355 RepID=A0A0A1TVD8_ENTIV|nr:hypothetical protein EIN_065910 [Entamoeba invadens IP1]ELP84306.1 hypothetical protein EIN_065910 [Entamoeba invadens IP1]|eukprot:XP_004183652.1 hypothetical protein EIN_065910 [Entamoeba invadens IP1]
MEASEKDKMNLDTLKRKCENVRLQSILAFEFPRASTRLEDLLNLADKQTTVSISSYIDGVISYFISSLSKKSQVDTAKDKHARIIWLRNFFIGTLINSIINYSASITKKLTICFKELLLILRYTPRVEGDTGILMLWRKIIILFENTPEKGETLLQIISGFLKTFYRLTCSIEGMNKLMSSVKFSGLCFCRSSIERASKVQYFMVVSRYGNLRYTNTLSIILPIIEPLGLANDELAFIMSKEYCKGICYIIENSDVFSHLIKKMGIYSKLDVDGVIQFMKEMAIEDTDKFSLCSPEFYILFHISAWIGMCCDNINVVASATDFLSEYLPYVFSINRRLYDTYLVILLAQILQVFLSTKFIPTKNSCIKLAVLYLEHRVDLFMNFDKDLFAQFLIQIQSDVQTVKDKKEYIIFLSTMLSSGKTSKEVMYLTGIRKYIGVNYTTIQPFFDSAEGSRQIQGVYIALTKIITFLATQGVTDNPFIVPYLEKFLSFEPTHPPLVKTNVYHLSGTIAIIGVV